MFALGLGLDADETERVKEMVGEDRFLGCTVETLADTMETVTGTIWERSLSGGR